MLNVFIYADIEERAKRIVQEYGERNDKSIKKRLKERDTKRKIYYKTYTDREYGAMHNYDVSLNSSSLGIDSCVNIIYKLVKE